MAFLRKLCISRIGVFCEMEDVSWFLGYIIHGKSSTQSDQDFIMSERCAGFQEPGLQGVTCETEPLVTSMPLRAQPSAQMGLRSPRWDQDGASPFRVHSHPARGQQVVLHSGPLTSVTNGEL